jgi:outer membrane receptor protein involved in Fe transport
MKTMYVFLLLLSYTSFGQEKISGTIFDHESKEVLPFTQVVNQRTHEVVETNTSGYFETNGKIGKDSLLVSQIGYAKQIVLAKDSMSILLVTLPVSLNTITISANREYEKRTTIPLSMSSISARTIADNKPTSIDQVLNQQPGVNMADLGNEQHMMSIRMPIGTGSTYLYLEDGVPIRASGVFNHNALLEIDMANVSKIDIIRGPASSFYGSEAIGGALNFITKQPSFVPSAGIKLRANNLGYKRIDLQVSNTINKKWGIGVSGYYAKKNGGPIAYNDFSKLALSLNTDYFIDAKNKLSLTATIVDYYSDMSGSLDSLKFYHKTYTSNQTFTYRKVLAFRSKLAYKHIWNEKSKTSFTVYYRNNATKQNPSYYIRNDYNPYKHTGDPNLAHGQINENAFQSYGLILQHKQDFAFWKSSLVAGISADYSPNSYYANYIRIHVTDAGIYDSYTTRDSALANYQANLINLAAYAQFKFEPVKRLTFSLAVRFDDFNYFFKNKLDSNAFTAVLNSKNTFLRVTPKLGLTYNLKKYAGFYANFGQGFVPPQVTTLYVGYKVPTLKPIYFSSYELGAWLLLANKKIKIDLSLYRMDGENEIINVLQNDGTYINQNAGRTSHQGIEYGIQINPVKSLFIQLSGTNAMHRFVHYVESGVDYSGKQMSSAPMWVANAIVTYKPNFFKGFRISVEYRRVGKYFMDNLNTRVYKGYNLINLRFGYASKHFDVWLNIMNIANTLYSTQTSSSAWGQTYNLGQPINFTLGVGYHF